MNWVEIKKDTKVDNCIWVECIAEIKNNETNEVREYQTDEILEIGAEHPHIFNWQENNYACDCNRRIFFKKVNNELTDADWDIECSDDKFSVNLKNKRTVKFITVSFNNLTL